MREEPDQIVTLVFAMSLVTGFAIGRWWGKRVEREDLFRIIRAQRIIQQQEQ